MPSPIKDLLSSIRRWEVRSRSACHRVSAFLSAARDPTASLWHFQRDWGGNSFYDNNTLYTLWAFIRKGEAATSSCTPGEQRRAGLFLILFTAAAPGKGHFIHQCPDGGWEGGSAVKSLHCSCGSEFCSQHHMVQRTEAPGALLPSGLHTSAHIHIQTYHTHIFFFLEKNVLKC